MPIHSDSDTTYAFSHDTGRLMHVSKVQRGRACNCICPMCRQPMIANQGKKNQHYFSHERKPDNKYNAELCHEVTMHMLAEQILMEKKSVMLPPYYDFSVAKQIHFVNVEVEERNDRPDIQPDIVGITEDDKRYLIEIKYSHPVDVEKKKKIYAENLTCLEIDISKQNMDTLEIFLLNHSYDREWINNKYAFESIVDIYKSKGINVKVIPCNECRAKYAPENCPSCVKSIIMHRGMHYVICSSVFECHYIQKEKWERIYDALDEPEVLLPPKKPRENTLLPKRKNFGDENCYLCIPDKSFKTIRDYYRNIERDKVFYKKNEVEYVITNHWLSPNGSKFGVVLYAKEREIPYFYVVVSQDLHNNMFVHEWSTDYFIESYAIDDLKTDMG